MWLNVFSLFFALLGLGFLIFIHELGHYWMARRVGMRVEAFGIGFGRPLFHFERKGVKWNIGWIPFGGYVKIAGMEQTKKKNASGKELELHEIEDGFFGGSPWNRIKVSFAGPAVNILFAFLVFSVLWLAGGRERNFSDITKKIGWIDPQSELYKAGVRPGDEIDAFDGQVVKGFKDHLQAAMTKGGVVAIDGRRFNAAHNSFEPFHLQIRPYQHPYLESGLLTFGALSPASFLVFPNQPEAVAALKGSPIEMSGIQPGDRIVSLDGERVYSFQQLSHLLNDGRVLVTVRRNNEFLQRRVPLVRIEELKLDPDMREELSDWQWESALKNEKLNKLFFIPYNLNSEGVVEAQVALIDKDKESSLFPKVLDSASASPLQKGDEIVAINGAEVHTINQLLTELQAKKVTLIVQRNWQPAALIPAVQADAFFENLTAQKDLQDLQDSIGTPQALTAKGEMVRLLPVVPKTRHELQKEMQARNAGSSEEDKKLIQAIDNPEKRAKALKALEARENQLMLGLPALDLHVSYNPNPVSQFEDITSEMTNTLSALIGGYLNPKWISGPVGIVQVFQSQWTVGFKEALFWLGIISLNLGLLNLLPLPILDGGYITLSIFEIITGVRLKAKTIEKIVVPFAILLIGFFIFITFNDVSRLITHLWPLK